MSNYDETTHAMFKHFLGSNDSRIDQLVAAAQAHDLNRMSEREIDQMLHVSDKREKAEALEEVKKLYQAGAPCITRVMEMDKLLGYDMPV
mmetsp:Transcript_15168/g.31751  ORF Transcript_15168/g.31751 Transcript_15168/m.31751 type:complete len:90 (+) Transcript_15168:478-747(+)